MAGGKIRTRVSAVLKMHIYIYIYAHICIYIRVLQLLERGGCLVTLLGIGKKRLAKAESSHPDLRYGIQQRGTTPEAESCHSFFHRSYTKLGESLPDKFVRRKKSKRGSDDSDSSDGGEFEVEQDADHSALLQWLDRSDDTSLQNICLNEANLPKWWLPPGNLAELYDHYSVVQSLLEGPVASCLGFEIIQVKYSFSDLLCVVSMTMRLSTKVEYILAGISESLEGCSWVPAKNRVA